MTSLALATGAINLGQGFPDTDGPAVLLHGAPAATTRGRGSPHPGGPGVVLAAAGAAIRDGVSQSPPPLGEPVLRSAIARHQARWYGLEHDPDTEILVTAGATEALAGALLGML